MTKGETSAKMGNGELPHRGAPQATETVDITQHIMHQVGACLGASGGGEVSTEEWAEMTDRERANYFTAYCEDLERDEEAARGVRS